MAQTLFTPAHAAALPLQGGRVSALVFQHGTLELRWYAPRGVDAQVPHDRDELYVVVTGSGTFVCDALRMPFGAGASLFVPAGANHRFEDFTRDFAAWVMFYGPIGGESA